MWQVLPLQALHAVPRKSLQEACPLHRPPTYADCERLCATARASGEHACGAAPQGGVHKPKLADHLRGLAAAMPSTLLLSALALVTCGHLAAAQVTPVATFEQLKQAITSGAAHIELQAHLDLRNVAQGQTAVFQDPAFQTLRVRPCALHRPECAASCSHMRRSAESVGCVQGSCENAPLSFGAFTFAGKEPRMCVILLGATRQLFAWPQGLPGASAVWLDSLWLQSTADSQGGAPHTRTNCGALLHLVRLLRHALARERSSADPGDCVQRRRRSRPTSL